MKTLKEQECINCAAPLPGSPDVPGGVVCEHCGCLVEGIRNVRLTLPFERSATPSDGGRFAWFRRHTPWFVAPLAGAFGAAVCARYLSAHRTPYMGYAVMLFALPSILLLRLSGRRMATVAVAFVAALTLLSKPFLFPLAEHRYGPFAWRVWEEFHFMGLAFLAVGVLLLLRIPRHGWRAHVRLLNPGLGTAALFAAGLAAGVVIFYAEFIRPPPPGDESPVIARRAGRHAIEVHLGRTWPEWAKIEVRLSEMDVPHAPGNSPRYRLEVAVRNGSPREQRYTFATVEFLDARNRAKRTEKVKLSSTWLRPGDGYVFVMSAINVERWLSNVRLTRLDRVSRPAPSSYRPGCPVPLRWRVRQLSGLALGLNMRRETAVPAPGSGTKAVVVLRNSGTRGIRRLVLTPVWVDESRKLISARPWTAVSIHDPPLVPGEARVLEVALDPGSASARRRVEMEVNALWIQP